MRTFLRNAFVREAPFVGAGVTITIDSVMLLMGASEVTALAVGAIGAAWVAVYVRAVSTPRELAEERAEEAVSAARDAVLADVSRLTPLAAPARARKPVRKPAAKAGPKKR